MRGIRSKLLSDRVNVYCEKDEKIVLREIDDYIISAILKKKISFLKVFSRWVIVNDLYFSKQRMTNAWMIYKSLVVSKK